MKGNNPPISGLRDSARYMKSCGAIHPGRPLAAPSSANGSSRPASPCASGATSLASIGVISFPLLFPAPSTHTHTDTQQTRQAQAEWAVIRTYEGRRPRKRGHIGPSKQATRRADLPVRSALAPKTRKQQLLAAHPAAPCLCRGARAELTAKQIASCHAALVTIPRSASATASAKKACLDAPAPAHF